MIPWLKLEMILGRASESRTNELRRDIAANALAVDFFDG
jgi:hypothetical protein